MTVQNINLWSLHNNCLTKRWSFLETARDEIQINETQRKLIEEAIVGIFGIKTHDSYVTYEEEAVKRLKYIDGLTTFFRKNKTSTQTTNKIFNHILAVAIRETQVGRPVLNAIIGHLLVEKMFAPSTGLLEEIFYIKARNPNIAIIVTRYHPRKFINHESRIKFKHRVVAAYKRLSKIFWEIYQPAERCVGEGGAKFIADQVISYAFGGSRFIPWEREVIGNRRSWRLSKIFWEVFEVAKRHVGEDGAKLIADQVILSAFGKLNFIPWNQAIVEKGRSWAKVKKKKQPLGQAVEQLFWSI